MNRLLFALALAVLLTAGASEPLWAQPTEPTVPLVGNHPAGVDFSTAKAAPPDMALHMRISFKFRNREELDRFLEDQHNPDSPDYQRALTGEEMNARFGTLAEDFDAVAGWLRSQGFTVTDERREAPAFVSFAGTVAQAEQTFAIMIVMIGEAGAYGNTTDPSIPARFAGLIGSIGGLDNMLGSGPGIIGSRHQRRS